MRSAEVVASCVGHAAPYRPAARRRIFSGALIAVVALWSLALMPGRDTASFAGAKGAANGQDVRGLAAFPLGEPIAVAVTPEWEPLVRQLGNDLMAANPRLRFYVHTAPADVAFRQMERGEVLAVVAPRLMTRTETLSLVALNRSVVQSARMLNHRHLFRPYPTLSSIPPSEHEFLFLYLRGEALTSRPGLQAFRNLFARSVGSSTTDKNPAQVASSE